MDSKVTEKYFVMPDGVKLYTRIIEPCDGKEKHPIVFVRTPYAGALSGMENDKHKEIEQLVKGGYAVVTQHTRGKIQSEGICTPYNEREDGLASLEQIRQLPCYNGEIYLYGLSYLSSVHLSYLDTNPYDVKGAVIDIQTDNMYFRNYRNGCCYNWCNYIWWLNMIWEQYPEQKRELAEIRPYKDLMKRVLGEDYPLYTNNLLNDTYNEFWKSNPMTRAIDNLKIPVLFTEGWYDFYTEGMFSMWERMPDTTRQKSAFIVGPWGHDTVVGKNAEHPLVNGNIPEDFYVEWFNSIREERAYKYAETGKVNFYSLGSSQWHIKDYPISLQETKKLWFSENGRLSEHPQTEAKGITYKYNPEKRTDCFKYLDVYKANPVNTVDGVISFVSDEFDTDTSFFGKIQWNMDVSSDCEDTAFFMRVYLVENGEAYNITETITSLSHINDNYVPGERININLQTPPCAFTVKKGCSIRVDIASDGGKYVPHANVKAHWAEVTETKIANNTIHLDGAYIELPTE